MPSRRYQRGNNEKGERSPKEIWADESRRLREQAMIDAAKADDPNYSGPSLAVDPQLRRDWEKLKVLATIKFPPHLAARFSLTPEKKIAAVAASLGWSNRKIAEASGRSDTTVKHWFEDDELKEFTKAYEFFMGTRDSKELVAKGQYNALMVLEELMTNPDVSASTRSDIAKWFYEQQHGKPKESREITGINVRELTEQLQRMKRDACFVIDDAFAGTNGKKQTTN